MKPGLFVALLGLLLPLAPWGPAALATSPEALAYEVDAGHSSTLFRVKHFDVSYVYGRFNEISGEILLDEESPENSSVAIEIPTASVDTNSPERDDHLRGSMFLATEEHPTMSFRSTSVKTAGAERYVIVGDLTLRGVSRELTVEAEHVGTGPDPWGGQRVGFELQFVIDAAEFEMPYVTTMKMLGTEIRVIVSVEAVRRS